MGAQRPTRLSYLLSPQLALVRRVFDDPVEVPAVPQVHRLLPDRQLHRRVEEENSVIAVQTTHLCKIKEPLLVSLKGMHQKTMVCVLSRSVMSESLRSYGL